MVKTALMVMMAAVLAHHLGLSEAVAKVVSKILKCPRCLSFWTVLFVLVILGNDPVFAVALSILMAYLSIWSGLLLIWLNDLYERIWQKTRKGS